MTRVTQADVLGQWVFAADQRNVAQARHLVRRAVGCLTGPAGGEQSDDLVLIVSELVANSVLHTPSPVVGLVLLKVGTGAGTRVRVCVQDGSSTVPVVRVASAGARGGRGMRLVEELTGSRWGVELLPHGGGKSVWAEYPVPDGGVPLAPAGPTVWAPGALGLVRPEREHRRLGGPVRQCTPAAVPVAARYAARLLESA